MASQRIDFKVPVGRLVQGSIYKANDKDAEGNPLVIKRGPRAGQPRVEYFFAVAIPKTAPQWWSEPWASPVVQAANASFPGGQAQSPAFAWKIKDGDSAVPNRKGKKPCDQEGFRGCWVVYFSGGFQPKVLRLNDQAQPVPWLDADAINLGDYVEVFGNVEGNDSPNQPGVYINHSMVCFRGYGERIYTGPDASAVGFGAGALPPGASATPIGSAFPPSGPGMPPPGVPAAPVAPASAAGYAPAPGAMGAPGMGYAPPAVPAVPVGGSYPAPGAPAAPAMAPQYPAPAPMVAPGPGMPPGAGVPAVAPVMPPAMNGPVYSAAPAQPAGLPVTPHPGILTPGVPAAPAERPMLPAAGGIPYSSWRASGWTDEMLIRDGKMAA